MRIQRQFLILTLLSVLKVSLTMNVCGENCMDCSVTEGCKKCFNSVPMHGSHYCMPNYNAEDKCIIYDIQGNCEMCMMGYGNVNGRCTFLIMEAKMRETCKIGFVNQATDHHSCMACLNSYPDEMMTGCLPSDENIPHCEIGARKFGKEIDPATGHPKTRLACYQCEAGFMLTSDHERCVQASPEGCMIASNTEGECFYCDFTRGYFDLTGDKRTCEKSY